MKSELQTAHAEVAQLRARQDEMDAAAPYAVCTGLHSSSVLD